MKSIPVNRFPDQVISRQALSAFFQAQSISDEELLELDREDMRQREASRFQQQLRAFWKGIEQSRGR